MYIYTYIYIYMLQVMGPSACQLPERRPRPRKALSGSCEPQVWCIQLQSHSYVNRYRPELLANSKLSWK